MKKPSPPKFLKPALEILPSEEKLEKCLDFLLKELDKK